MRTYLLAGISTVFLAFVFAPSRAEAQVSTDFASCPQSLSVCDANHDDCCIRAFDPIATDKAIVIPMDRCHQVVAQSGTLSPPSATAAYCFNAGPFSSNDNGMYETYGLVFRLMQNGIPIYWIINPTKEPPALTANQNLNSQDYTTHDIDTWIVKTTNSAVPSTFNASLTACTGACTPPVKLINNSTMLPTAAWAYSKREFPIRGGAFVIAPEDRPRFNDFMKHTGEFASFANNANYNFDNVDLYEVQNNSKFVYQDYRTAQPYTMPNNGNGAPVAVRIDYAPPRLARLAPAGVSQTWLGMAKLNSPANYPACKSGAFSPADAVFCDVTVNDIGNGTLVSGGFTWVWIDNWNDNSPCSTQSEIDQVNALRTFFTAQPNVRSGGHGILMEAVIGVMEGCANKQLMGTVGASVGLATGNTAPVEPLILRRPYNLFMQWGDLPTSFAQGAVTHWRYFGGGANGYDASHTDATTGTLVRLASEDNVAAGNAQCVKHVSTSTCDVYANNANSDYYDVASYLRFQDNPANGVVFYMPGNQVTNGPSHLRMVLNTLIAMPIATVPQLPNTQIHEVSRSSPVVGFFNGLDTAFHGSFVLQDPPPVVPTYAGVANDATFTFPYSIGHYRATNVALGTDIWDAANGIPAVTASGCGTWFTSSCRTVFTNATTGTNIARTYLTTATSTVTTLQPLLTQVGNITLNTAETQTLISRILAGVQSGSNWVPGLGGIDRSSAALVERSPLIANGRPHIAYVGGLDGMLHAICIDITGACTAQGQELWAFIPRVLLPRLRLNDGRFDGSPKVADVFDDYDNDGRREWKTILTFQVGSGQAGTTGFSPAVYALDVTNPADPKILWEVVPPAVRDTYELGVGTSLAMGPVQTQTGFKNMTWVVSNNGGTGSAGLYVAALNTATGAVEWTFTQSYANPRISAHPPVPASGYPGGPVAIDENQTGNATKLAVPSLYGDVWMLNAVTGANIISGNNPLFRMGSDYHPIGASPSLYSDGGGRLLLAFGTGGYTDPVSTSWAPASENQYMISISIDPANAPVSESSGGGDVAFAVPLGIGQRVYSQAVVAGGELFVTSDTGDVNDANYGLGNDTGQLTRIALVSGTVTDTATLQSGAASVDTIGGRVYSLDEASVHLDDFSSNFDSAGSAVEFSMLSSNGAKLWLRVE